MKFFSFNDKLKIKKFNFINYRIFTKFKKSLFFNIIYKFNDFNYPRLGVFISKKHIKLSNKRNYIKRIIKEKFRINKSNIYNFDYIFFSKKKIYMFFKKVLINDIDYILKIFNK